MKNQAREVWLNTAISKLAPLFSEVKPTVEVPKKVRVSCGWPSVGGTRAKKRAIGEAWASENSKDKHFEIFVSPYLDDAHKVLATLAHEMVHVTVGLKCGHKGKFALVARGIGLEGKMTATYASDPLKAKLAKIAKDLGPYPHATLDGMTNYRKKQSTRMVKAHCTFCTYTVRASLRWLLLAVPNCPNPDCVNLGKPMEVELPDENGEQPE